MNDRVKTASKYRKVSAKEIRERIRLVSKFENHLPKAKEQDLWVFEFMKDAAEASMYFKNKINVKPNILAMENDPAWFHLGITCCIFDWDKTGYLMAHALIGDIPIKKSSKKFMDTGGTLWERSSTMSHS